MEAQECLGYGVRDVTLTGRVYAFEAFAEDAGDISRTRKPDYHALVVKLPFCAGGRGGPVERHVGIVELVGPQAAALVGRDVKATGRLAPSDGETAVKMAVRSLQPEK